MTDRAPQAERERLAIEVWNGFHRLLSLCGWTDAEISAAVLDRRLERLICEPLEKHRRRYLLAELTGRTGWSARSIPLDLLVHRKPAELPTPRGAHR